MTSQILNEAFSANKITIIIYKRVFRSAVNTCVRLPIFRGLDARGGKNYEQAHTHTRDNHRNDNNNYYKLFEALALKLIRIIYTVLMQNRSCFMRLSMLRPTPPLQGIGVGLGRGFATKLRPRGGAFDLRMRQLQCLRICTCVYIGWDLTLDSN